MDKDIRPILKALKKAGYTVRISKSGHPMIYLGTERITTFPGTTGDHRALRNSLAPLKRRGFTWPPKR